VNRVCVLAWLLTGAFLLGSCDGDGATPGGAAVSTGEARDGGADDGGRSGPRLPIPGSRRATEVSDPDGDGLGLFDPGETYAMGPPLAGPLSSEHCVGLVEALRDGRLWAGVMWGDDCLAGRAAEALPEFSLTQRRAMVHPGDGSLLHLAVSQDASGAPVRRLLRLLPDRARIADDDVTITLDDDVPPLDDDPRVTTACEPDAFWIGPDGTLVYRCDAQYRREGDDDAFELPEGISLLHLGAEGHFLLYDAEQARYAIGLPDGSVRALADTRDWPDPAAATPPTPADDWQARVHAIRARDDGFWLLRGSSRMLLRHDGSVEDEGRYPGETDPETRITTLSAGVQASGCPPEQRECEYRVVIGDYSECGLQGSGALLCEALWEGFLDGVRETAYLRVELSLSQPEVTVLAPPGLRAPADPDPEAASLPDPVDGVLVTGP
jgi:hypothetical protein